MRIARDLRWDWIVLVSLVLLTAAVYGQVYNHSFIQYDDPGYITENLVIYDGLSWKGLRWAFTTFTAANWHPLTWLSHMLDVQLFGLKPGMHHLVSVVFHLFNTILLFVILRQMTGALWRSAFVAALFALHPLHVESVAWAAERKDVLSTFFWLLTMGAYVRYVKKPGLSGYLPVLLFFALGLMAKPMLVTLPLVLLLLDYWPLGRLKRNEPRPSVPHTPLPTPEKKRKRRTPPQPREPQKQPFSKEVSRWSRFLPLLYEKIPLLALSAVSSIITIYAQQKGGAVASFAQLPLLERLAHALMSYAAYLWKMLWPVGLVIFYPFEPLSPSVVLASALLLSAATFVSVRWASKSPYLWVGWLWYLITLLPVIGIIKVGDAAMADRYTYVTLIGPFVALTWGACDLSKKVRLPKTFLPTAAVLVTVTFTVLTYIQLGHWTNSITLFQHVINVNGRNFMAHNSLAVEFISQKKYAEALPHLQSALEINPYSPEANLNLGIIHYHAGNYDEAIQKVTRALRLKPDWYQANEWLGKIYLAKGDADKAMSYFNLALQTLSQGDPSSGGMGQALIFQNRLDEALRYTLQAMETQPQNEKLYNNAGYILIRLERIDEAILQFREAVRIAPGYAKAHSNLGAALMQRNQFDEAIQHFQTALRLDPGNESAQENLKYALAQKQKMKK
ncbi:MAG TPA: tetratricopeptide repeat protein [Syntrophales bacterium]|nr:tetratricopeptide repeat protein [Syntrophales bacterium]